MTGQGDAKISLSLEEIQKQMEDVAKTISCSTRTTRREESKTFQEVRRGERATAVCIRPIEGKLKRKQAKKTKARHAVKCCLMLVTLQKIGQCGKLNYTSTAEKYTTTRSRRRRS